MKILFFNSIYMNYLEYVALYQQKMDWWMSDAWGMGIGWD